MYDKDMNPLEHFPEEKTIGNNTLEYEINYIHVHMPWPLSKLL